MSQEWKDEFAKLAKHCLELYLDFGDPSYLKHAQDFIEIITKREYNEIIINL